MNNAPKSKKNNAGKAAKQAKTAAKAAKSAAKSAKRAEQKAGSEHAAERRAQVVRDTGGLDAEAAAIAGSIIVPDAFPATRLQDGYDNMPTALFEPKVIADVPFSSVEDTDDNLGYPFNEQWLFAFRDPRRGIIIPQHSHPSACDYRLSQSTIFGPSSAISMGAGAQLAFDACTAAVNGLLLDDGYIMPGTSDDGTGGYFPLSYGDAIVQTAVGGMAASTPATVNLDICDGDDVTQQVAITATTTAQGLCTWTFDNAGLSVPVRASWTGYVRVRSVSIALVAANISLRYTANNFAAVHMTLANFATVQAMIDSFRANGLSMMFTNTVPPINRSGDVCAYQVPKGVAWTSLMGQGFASMTKRPGAITKRADKGIQISWKPSAPLDMQFLQVGVGENDSEFYPITPQSDYLAICLNIPLGTGRGGIVQVHCNAEGRTSSPWFAQVVDVPGARNSTAVAMDFIRPYPQVHENPNHLRDAIAFLKKNKAGIGKIAGIVGTAVPGLAPLANIVSSVAAQM